MGEIVQAGWKLPGIMNGIDPQKSYEEIFGDGQNHTAAEIVEMAKNKSSAMHKYFEWNNAKASSEYRKIQAQRLVRNFVLVRIEPETEKKEKTVFRLVEATSSRKNEYAPIKFFLQNRDEYSELLRRAKIELESFKKRYAAIVELDAVIREIDEVLAV